MDEVACGADVAHPAFKNGRQSSTARTSQGVEARASPEPERGIAQNHSAGSPVGWQIGVVDIMKGFYRTLKSCDQMVHSERINLANDSFTVDEG